MSDPLERLSDQCNQEMLLEFEGFVIRKFDGWHLWLENPDGEGCTVRKSHFLNILANLFDESF
ncbi:MAG TPA: hypothetical protein VIJ14_10495 [Rhabdochlamydiaceae bacterium]